MPKYTDEQLNRAKNADVRTFLEQTEGYSFEGHGRFIKCRNAERTNQPSSLSIDTHLNRIFYNSVTGNRPLSAVDWCTQIKNMDFQSAMKCVLEEEPQGARAERPKFQQHRPQPEISALKNLELSEKSDTSKNVYAYLTKTRGIPQNIVNDCLNQSLIYQDVRKNAVFVGYDDDNKAKYAARRGTFTPDGKEPFKRDCSGSDKNFAFRLEGKNTETVYVAEAAIDVLSLAALEDKFNGVGAYKEKTYLSTGGAGIDNALEQFCKTHDVKVINICFDDDEAGKNGMEKIMQKFRERGYTVNDMRASMAHDYNDELVAFNNNPDFYSAPPDVVKSVSERETERSDKMPNDISNKGKIERALDEIFANYSCMYERREIEALPINDQLHIADVYNKRPFNENDINTYDISRELDSEIFKEININDFKKIIGADDLSRKGIEITEIKTKSYIGSNYLFADNTLTSEDIHDSFSMSIHEISFRNSDNETMTFSNFTDLKKALDNPNDTFFHKSNEIISEKGQVNENIPYDSLNDNGYGLDYESLPPDELAYMTSNELSEQDEYIPFDDYMIPDEQNYYEQDYEPPYQERYDSMPEMNISQEEFNKPQQTEQAKMQGLFSVEQNGEVMYRTTDMTAKKLLNISANSKNPYIDMSAIGESISREEYFQIKNSDRFTFSADINLDNNSASLYAVNMGRGGISESNRTPENIYLKTVLLSDYVRSTPEMTVSDKQKRPVQTKQPKSVDTTINRPQMQNISSASEQPEREQKTQHGYTVNTSERPVQAKQMENVKTKTNRSQMQNISSTRKQPQKEQETQPNDVTSTRKRPIQPNPQKKEETDIIRPQIQRVYSTNEQPQIKPEEKVNGLLQSIKDKQESKRAELLDKIGKIDSKIADRQERIGKLENKIADIETSLKTFAALKHTFGDTPFGKLIDMSIEKKHKKIQQIRDEKIPKHRDKISIQNAKKSKAVTKLNKVNRKIDKIDKVQNFLSAIGSKDREERHKGFVTGLENLSDIRRESLENKLHKTETKIDMLSAKYSSPDYSHAQRYEMGKSIRTLQKKASDLTAKIEKASKLHSDLEDMKNGKFTDNEIENAVCRTADKISECIENPNSNTEKGIINTMIAQSVNSGNEAISEVVSERAREQAVKSAPVAERERVPEERQPDITENAEQKIINAVAAVTGIAVSELTRLPADIKSDIISEYKENNGNITAGQLTERICEIADIEPPKEIKAQEQSLQVNERKEKENSVNENQKRIADTVIREQVADDKPLFSRSKLMSDDFKPKSEKSHEDLNAKKDHNIGI